MVNLEDVEVKEEAFENPLLSLHLKCMCLYGFFVSSDQHHKRFHLRKGDIFTVSFAISCCLIKIKVSRGFENLADGATSCATAFLYLTTTIAMANALFQRTRIVRMVNFIHDDISSLLRITDAVEENMMAETVKYLRVVAITMWSPSVLAGFIEYIDCFYRTIFLPDTVFNIPQVLNGTAVPILLFQLFPFGEVYDNFVVGYMGSCFALFLGVTAIPCWHTFVTCLMKYIVVKYEIINKRLKDYDIAKLSTEINKDDIKNMSEQELLHWHTKMCEFCVNEQIKIRRFAHELEALIRIPVFADFILFSLLLCFLLYAITSGTPSKMDFIFITMYLFVMALILWLYHWHGTLIAGSNDDLCFALYSCRWYKFPVHVQKSIRLMMMDSTRPLIIKAIFVELNLKTFINIVRGAYSYFSILRNANLE